MYASSNFTVIVIVVKFIIIFYPILRSYKSLPTMIDEDIPI